MKSKCHRLLLTKLKYQNLLHHSWLKNFLSLCCLIITTATPFSIDAQCTNPTVTAFALSASCTNDVPNDDGYLQIGAATNATHYNFIMGSDYSTGDSDIANATAFDPATDLPLQFGTLNNPVGSQDYTIRIFNGVSSCFTDVTVTLQEQDCSVGCDCKEYIYLNEPFIEGVLKFELSSDILLNEITQANGGTAPDQHWYPGTGASELPFPHGAVVDLNGFLYIGSDITPNNPIRKLSCDGTIYPMDSTTIITNGHSLTGMFTIGNILYTTSGGPASYDLCTGEYLGAMCLNHISGDLLSNVTSSANWGIYYNKTLELVYTTGQQTAAHGIWVFTKTELENGIQGGPCIDPFIWRNDTVDYASLQTGDQFLPNDMTVLHGITADNAGNIYVTGWLTDDSAFVLKYDSDGKFVTKSPLSANYQFARGIVWSEYYNRIYIANQTDNPVVDCISVFDANTLTYLGIGAPNPDVPEDNSAKAMSIIRECCPSNNRQVINQTYCVSGGNDQLFLNELFPCTDGIICEAQWTPTDAASVAIFESCDQSIQENLTPGCYSFTRSSDGLNGKQCGAFEQTFNLEIVDIGIVTMSADQTICDGKIPLELNISIANSTTGNIRWQMSTTSCTSGFTDIIGANGATYQPPALNVTTYYKAIVNEPGNCSSSLCGYESNCITITVENFSSSISNSNICNDNGTPSIDTDDWFSIDVSASISTPGGSNQYEVALDANLDGTGGTVLGTSTYGTVITLGDGTNGATGTFAADGTTVYSITVRDVDNPTCFEVFTTTTVDHCSFCPTENCFGVRVKTSN